VNLWYHSIYSIYQVIIDGIDGIDGIDAMVPKVHERDNEIRARIKTDLWCFKAFKIQQSAITLDRNQRAPLVLERTFEKKTNCEF
jgi:hypothetical protein